MTTPVTRAVRGVPPDFAALISRVTNFSPEGHGDLLAFIAGQASGLAAYSDALAEVVETCRTDVGLDPSSVQAITDCAEIAAEGAAAMTAAGARFRQVYEGVIEAAENGVAMPHRGRFFSDQGA